MIEYIREIDTTKWGEEQKNNIKEYKGKPGVWILLGKEHTDAPLVCLQVGATKYIGEEIERDIFFLNQSKEPEKEDNDYVNQFGEHMFSYKICPGRAQVLYWDISKKYTDLIFICVAHGDELENKELRKDIEKYVAYRTLSRYWVNGGQYKGDKSEEEIKSIKESCKKECAGLFEKIKRNYKGADMLNEFLNNLIEGKIEVADC